MSTPYSRPSPYHSECHFNLWPQVKSRTGACRYSHSPSDARSYSTFPPPATTSVSLAVVSADLPPHRPTVLRIPRNGTNTGSTLVHAKEQPPRDNNTQLPTEGQPKTSRQGEERVTSEVTAEGGPTTTTAQTREWRSTTCSFECQEPARPPAVVGHSSSNSSCADLHTAKDDSRSVLPMAPVVATRPGRPQLGWILESNGLWEPACATRLECQLSDSH